MLFNILEAAKNPSGTISYFRGLNRRYKGSAGEFADMENISSSGYPCLTPRQGREYIDDDGIKNKRVVIPPLNKSADKNVPGFTGIAGKYFYYEGSKISNIDNGTLGEFSQGHIEEQNKWFDGIQYLDMSELFPEGKGTEFSYCYLNNRLFIFVTNTIGLDDLGYVGDVKFRSSDISGRTTLTTVGGTFYNLYGNVITINNEELAAIVRKYKDYIKGRNVEITADNSSSTFIVKYYVTDVAASGNKVIITLNEPINANPFMDTGGKTSANAKEFTLRLHRDSGKYYYDAGKGGEQGLHNMERGVCNIPCDDIFPADYRDHELGLRYTDTYAIECIGRNDGGISVDFGKYFKAGDMIKIYGCYNLENNTVIPDSQYIKPSDTAITACRVVGIEYNESWNGGSRLYVQSFNAAAQAVHMKSEHGGGSTNTAPYVGTYCITKVVPNMSEVAAHNQRLWGVNRTGEFVYASMASDPFTWYTWEDAGASDPIQITADTKDEYTGVLEYGQYVLLLKPTSIQQVYSLASASTVQIARAMYNAGCIDKNSALVIGSTAYYLGYNGFYRYTGAEPELISEYLNTEYVAATAFTDGVKYYASAKRADGVTELVVYDTRYGFWHKEDSTDVLGGYQWYDKTIVVTKSGETYIMNSAAADTKNSGEIPVKWSADSVAMYEGTMDSKAVNEIWLRAYIPKGSAVTVYTNVNGGEWKKHMTFEGADRVKVYKTPIRAIDCEEYRFRIEGRGPCVIYELERKMAVGGRNHNPAREGGIR